MEQGIRTSATLADARREHLDGFVKRGALKLAVRRGAAHHRVEIVFFPLFLRRRLGHDLLGQHLDRRFRLANAIEVAPLDGADHRRALDQFIQRRREERAVGNQA